MATVDGPEALLAAVKEIDRLARVPNVRSSTEVVAFARLRGAERSRATAATWAWLVYWHDRLEGALPAIQAVRGSSAWARIEGALTIAHRIEDGRKVVDRSGYLRTAGEIEAAAEALGAAMAAAALPTKLLEKMTGTWRASVLWIGRATVEQVSPLGRWRSRQDLAGAAELLARWFAAWPSTSSPAERVRVLRGEVQLQTVDGEAFRMPELDHIAIEIENAIGANTGRIVAHADVCAAVVAAAADRNVIRLLRQPKRGALHVAAEYIGRIGGFSARAELARK